MRISETVRATAKRTNFLDHPRKKHMWEDFFNFWSCDNAQVAIQSYFALKNAYLRNGKS